jgi:hypothetical protein
MTTMMIKRTLLLLAVLLIPLAIYSQRPDFGIWYEVSAERKIVKGLRCDLETSIRTEQNASNIESFYLEPGLRYKINDYFSAGFYYRFIEQKEKNGKYYPRHRWSVQLKGELPVERFTISARYRIQEQFRTYIKDPEDEIPEWYNRLRLEIEYDIKGLPLKPYLNAEARSLLFSANNIMIEKWRYIAGVEYTLHKRHTFSVEYIYNTSKVSKPAYANIIGLTYSVKL